MERETLKVFMTALESANDQMLDQWLQQIKDQINKERDLDLYWQAYHLRLKIAELETVFLMSSNEQKILEATNLVDYGEFDEARGLCIEVIHEEPMFIDAHIQLAIIDSQTSLTDDPMAMQSRGVVGDYLYAMAVDLSESGYLEKARDEFQKVIFLDKTNYFAITNLGQLLFQEGEVDRAIAAYRVASAYPHYDATAMYNLAHSLSSKGEDEEAELWHQRALLTEPRDFRAMVNLSNLKETKGEIDEAEKLLKSALAIEPEDSIALMQLAYIYRNRNQLFEAEMLYRKSAGVDSRSALSYFNLADFLMEHGDKAEAQYFFDLAYELDPDGDLKRGKT